MALLAYTHLPLLEITKGELPSGEPDVAGFPSKHADDSKPGAARARHCVASHKWLGMPTADSGCECSQPMGYYLPPCPLGLLQ